MAITIHQLINGYTKFSMYLKQNIILTITKLKYEYVLVHG